MPFSSPSPHVFQASTGALAVDAVVKVDLLTGPRLQLTATLALPFTPVISCCGTVQVSQGHLYPLSDALCFLDKVCPLTDGSLCITSCSYS